MYIFYIYVCACVCVYLLVISMYRLIFNTLMHTCIICVCRSFVLSWHKSLVVRWALLYMPTQFHDFRVWLRSASNNFSAKLPLPYCQGNSPKLKARTACVCSTVYSKFHNSASFTKAYVKTSNRKQNIFDRSAN